MSITLHTGLPRTGKTYALTDILIRALNEGSVVYNNYQLDWHGKARSKFSFRKWKRIDVSYPASNLRYWNTLHDLKDVENGIIGMDEAHVYMNSRRWESLPEEFQRKLAQHGKDGLHIIGTVQNVARLDTVFRELVDYWYIYKVFPAAPKHPWRKHRPWFFMKYEVVFSALSGLKPVGVKLAGVYPYLKWKAQRYDTLQKIRSGQPVSSRVIPTPIKEKQKPHANLKLIWRLVSLARIVGSKKT